MKKTEIHIFNGDALRKQMPQAVIGKRIVCRESLIEGPIIVAIDKDFYIKRADYFSQEYGFNLDEYAEKVVPEILKIKQTERSAHVYLWFEHDAFCQINLWFCAHLLIERKFTGKTFLVLPNTQKDVWIGFGNHNADDLILALENRILLAPFELRELGKCWNFYTDNKMSKLKRYVPNLSYFLPHSVEMVNKLAEFKRPDFILNELKSIIEKLEKPTFETVFEYFSKNNGILGLGDLIVKKAYDKLIA